MDYNFTFSNPSVEEFFSGDSPPSPTLVSAYQFLHNHPLIKPSFLTVIQDEVNNTHLHVQRKGIKGEAIFNPLVDAARRLGLNLPDDNPAEGLIALRDLYHACLALQKI
jgi:hypothetical protein